MSTGKPSGTSYFGKDIARKIISPTEKFLAKGYNFIVLVVYRFFVVFYLHKNLGGLPIQEERVPSLATEDLDKVRKEDGRRSILTITHNSIWRYFNEGESIHSQMGI